MMYGFYECARLLMKKKNTKKIIIKKIAEEKRKNWLIKLFITEHNFKVLFILNIFK